MSLNFFKRCLAETGAFSFLVMAMVMIGCDGSKPTTQTKPTETTANNAAQSSKLARLTIGSMAPTLDIEHWVQTGDGKFQPVKRFENGKVYVVELWATWCGPCIQSMPHLVELQKKYDQGEVQIVSVSDESLEEVQEFLKREAGKREGVPITFQELTAPYCLTTDPDGSTGMSYAQAAGIDGIPAAFIVGKDGRIEWIGHPQEMDEPLARVVEDTWNRDEFALQYNEEKDFEALKGKLDMMLQSDVSQGPPVEKINAAIQLVKEFSARAKVKHVITGSRFLLLDLYTNFRPDDKDVLPIAKEVFKDFAGRPMTLHTLAWGLYELSENGKLNNKELIQEALAATQASMASAKEEQRGTILDTIAHLQEYLGDLEGALISAKEAAQAPDASKESKKYVEDLQAAIDKAEKK